MSRKCEHAYEDERSCAQWAVRGSDPPRCRSHGGKALLPEPEPVKCGTACADGSPCQKFAVRGSDPPRCAAHGGSKTGRRVGAPSGPRNGMWRHGAYEGQTKEFTTIDDLIDDLMEKQARLSVLLDRVMDVREAMMMVSLHSQNAARLGKLMLNKKALEKDAQDPFEQVLYEVLEELDEELGLSLEKRMEIGD